MNVCGLAHEHGGQVFRERDVELATVRKQLRGCLDPGADERVGQLGPRHADLDVLESKLCRGELGRERSQQLDAAVHVGGHRPRVVEGGREREAAVERDETEGGLEAGRPAAGGRDPDRAAAVGAERGIREPGRYRGGRAAARPSGQTTRGKRVGNGAEVRVLRGRAVGELVQVRLPDVDPAGRLGATHGLRARGRHVVGEEDGAIGRDELSRVEQVLDGEPPPGRGLIHLRRSREKDPVGRSHRHSLRSRGVQPTAWAQRSALIIRTSVAGSFT